MHKEINDNFLYDWKSGISKNIYSLMNIVICSRCSMKNHHKISKWDVFESNLFEYTSIQPQIVNVHETFQWPDI